MNTTAKVHVTYVIGILIAVIISLVTVRWGSVPDLVNLLTFALTLTSIVLALLAIVYAFLSNTSLAQSLGQLGSVSNDVARSSESLAVSAQDLQGKIGQIPAIMGKVSDQVAATHELVRGMSNQESAQVIDHHLETASRDGAAMVAIASPVGKVALLMAAGSFQQKRAFEMRRLCDETGFDMHREYIWGWMMALDAIGSIDIRVAKGVSTVVEYDEALLKAIMTAADAAAPDADGRSAWTKESVDRVRGYFLES